ncbi:MAG: hypothetical protein IPL96_07310 [Holophagaceae bacterium]|nr:hypothetical protein [Holophagaceae bacterium]
MALFRGARAEGVGQVEDVGFGEGDGEVPLELAAVVGEGEGLAAAPQVLRGEAEAQGESEEGAVAALEEDLVDAGLLALDGDVHLGLVGHEVHLGLLGLHVEEAELAEARVGIL